MSRLLGCQLLDPGSNNRARVIARFSARLCEIVQYANAPGRVWCDGAITISFGASSVASAQSPIFTSSSMRKTMNSRRRTASASEMTTGFLRFLVLGFGSAVVASVGAAMGYYLKSIMNTRAKTQNEITK